MSNTVETHRLQPGDTVHTVSGMARTIAYRATELSASRGRPVVLRTVAIEPVRISDDRVRVYFTDDSYADAGHTAGWVIVPANDLFARVIRNRTS